jgi:glycogen operon protein
VSGSSDIYGRGVRSPYASINFVSCHDGFTLRDLVSYERKHNEANGEGNRDGTDSNWSWNCGSEGPCESEVILRRREVAARSMIATLAFSQGVPMISHGDELGRTQGGNNNAYCQDGPQTWVHWDLDASERELLEFTRRAFALRRENPVLRRRSFFSGRELRGRRAKDVTWLRPDGEEMHQQDWQDPERRVLGMLVSGEANDEVDERGRAIQGDTLLLLMNAGPRPRHFRLPKAPRYGGWQLVLSSSRDWPRSAGDAVNLRAHSVMLLVEAIPE